MKNANVQKAMKVVTIAGSAILVLNAAMSLTKVTGLKSAAMPLVTILVGVAAFNYAMQGTTVVVEKK
jgi:hypothetical protein